MSSAVASKPADLDIGNLFQQEADEGNLSAVSMNALNIIDIGAQLQAGLGVDLGASTQVSEVFLLTIVPDDSGSIRFAGNTKNVRDGVNSVLDAVLGSKQSSGIQAHIRLLNGDVICPFTPVSSAQRLTASNYDPTRGTPLYDQAVITLATVLAQTRVYLDQGIEVRSLTVFVTDGQDVHSRRNTARDVKAIVDDMRRQERHIVCGFGIEDPQAPTDFHIVFREMGIPDEWILTAKSDGSEIRRKFALVSQSAVRASQASAGNFSANMMGGFGS